jgi:hypothetical protein
MPELPRVPCCSGRGRRGLVSTALVGATQEAPRGGESQYTLLPAPQSHLFESRRYERFTGIHLVPLHLKLQHHTFQRSYEPKTHDTVFLISAAHPLRRAIEGLTSECVEPPDIEISAFRKKVVRGRCAYKVSRNGMPKTGRRELSRRDNHDKLPWAQKACQSRS